MVRSRAARQASKRACAQLRDGHGRFAATDLSDPRRMKTTRVRVEGRTYNIPVDDDGNVPEYIMAARFVDISAGNRKDALRSVPDDLAKTATRTIKTGLAVKPDEIKEWWAHPNEMDIIGIDDVTTKVFDTDGATRKGSLPSQRKIAIAGATGKERAYIRKTLDESFTAKELKTLTKHDDAVISVVPNGQLRPGVTGTYSPSTGLIQVERSVVLCPSTTTHEAVHKLRDLDRNGYRRGHTASKVRHDGRPITNNARNAEEAETVAETTARISPYVKTAVTSYYSFVASNDSEAYAKMDSDRKLFVGNCEKGRKGIKGKKVLTAIEKKFKLSEIGNLRYNTSQKAKNYK